MDKKNISSLLITPPSDKPVAEQDSAERQRERSAKRIPQRMSKERLREIDDKLRAAGISPYDYIKLPKFVRTDIWRRVIEGVVDGTAPDTADDPTLEITGKQQALRQDITNKLYGALAPFSDFGKLGHIRSQQRATISKLLAELEKPEKAEDVLKRQATALQKRIEDTPYLQAIWDNDYDVIFRDQGRLNSKLRRLLREIAKEDQEVAAVLDSYKAFEAEVLDVMQSLEEGAPGEEMLESIDYADNLPLVVDPPGALIEWLRKVYGWSQRELADRAGCKQQNIQQLETGVVWKSSHLPTIAAAFDVDTELFTLMLTYAPPRGADRGVSRVVEASATIRPFKKDTTPKVYTLDTLPYKFLGTNETELANENFSAALRNVEFGTIQHSKSFQSRLPAGSVLLCGRLSETVLDGQFFIGIVSYPYKELASAQVFQAKVLTGNSTQSGKFILRARESDEGYPFHDEAPLHRSFAGTGTPENSPPIRIVARVMGVYTSFDPTFDSVFTPNPNDD
jgi:transcriptional regulator with XRE-family HTH domain